MRRPQYLKLLRYRSTIDEGHEASASYRDEGNFPASIWDAAPADQREGVRPRHMLFASPIIRLYAHDRLMKDDTSYRVVWARTYTRHTEALIEEEQEPA